MKTITEALADLKLIQKKLKSKHEFINSYLTRPSDKVDPLQGKGGAEKIIQQELQAVQDLEDLYVATRDLINRANSNTTLTINDITMTVTQWLYWRREVYPARIAFLRDIFHKIQSARSRWGDSTWTVGQQEQSKAQLVVHIDEVWLQKELEILQEIEATLDGKLSLLNARTEINL